MKLNRILTAIQRYHRSKGHGIHSPFAFRFTLNVLRERLPYYAYEDLELLRRSVIDQSRRLWHHPRVMSYKNAKLLFRIVNFFNPTEILQIGTNYGLSSASMLAVSSKTVLHLCEPNVNEYHVTRDILSHFGNPVKQYANLNNALNVYRNSECGKSNPFILVNNIKNDEYSTLLNYIYDISQGYGVIVIRNIITNAVQKSLWEACKNVAPTGMTFCNGKTAIIVASPKLPHQNFSLWF